ncbi:cytochrome c [Verrucomicrobiaceae bacterium 227]
MSDSTSSSEMRPDLNESINVTEAHQALQDETPAVGREKRLLENGMEPVSLWLILISAVVVLVGGAVMGQGGAFFAYQELTKDGYMRAPSYVKEEVALLPGPALDLYRKEGVKHYSACAGCHQSSGMGVSGTYPPLAGSEWVNGPSERLAMIILNGIHGPIEVAGQAYNSDMGAIGANLGKKELATLMTYIRSEWGNDGSLVTIEMAENALEVSKARANAGKQVSSEELLKNHDKMLEGAPLAPDTSVDPITLEPVEAAAE